MGWGRGTTWSRGTHVSATCLDGFLGELSTSITHPPLSGMWVSGLLMHLPLLCLPVPQTGTPSKVSSKPGFSSFLAIQHCASHRAVHGADVRPGASEMPV